MTITDLDQLEHEHPALLAMHQRMKQEAETLRARVTELEEYLDAAMRNGMTTERARLKLATKLVELGEERDAWKARTREYVREYMEQDPDLRARELSDLNGVIEAKRATVKSASHRATTLQQSLDISG